ncbi:MAG: trypsin-like serine protease [Bdellovibrionaceae bacterium]|nr:trypsin-like serine protease [Bdellovibrio sp.]
MKLIIALTFLGVALTLACSPTGFHSSKDLSSPTDANHVIDGEIIMSRANQTEKSVVAVELFDRNQSVLTYCTGTLIGPNTVLTAAHCFNSKLLPGVIGFNIVFETRTKFYDPIRRSGFKFAQHPQYDSTPKEWYFSNGEYFDLKKHPEARANRGEIKLIPQNDHDLAVAVFNGSLPPGFELAVIDTDAHANYAGLVTQFYGYGRAVDYFDAKGRYDTSTGQLRKGTAIVDSDFSENEDRFYTKKNSKNWVCQGDSGGPQFITDRNGNKKIIGVNSGVGVNEASVRKVTDIENNRYNASNPESQKSYRDVLYSCRERSQIAKVGAFADWIKREEQRLLSQLPGK